MAFAFAPVRPASAQESSAETVYKDPTIVDDEAPEGVKAPVVEKKRDVPSFNSPPIYEKWWFWAGSVVATGALVFLALTPLTPKARSCAAPRNGEGFTMGCLGDGRPAQ